MQDVGQSLWSHSFITHLLAGGHTWSVQAPQSKPGTLGGSDAHATSMQIVAAAPAKSRGVTRTSVAGRIRVDRSANACSLASVSAYRAPAPPGPERQPDVRELTMRTLGTFAMGVWSGLAVIFGLVLAAAAHWAPGPGFDSGTAVRTILVATPVTAVLAAVLVALSDEQLRYVVRVEEGILEITKRRAFRRTELQKFSLRDIARVEVDDHGEDHIATFIHSGKTATPVFVTVHGDQARRVEAFLDDAIATWRAFTVKPEP